MKELFASPLLCGRKFALAVLVAAVTVTTAQASPVFTSFAGFTGSPPNSPPNGGELGSTITVPGWTNDPNGYNFIYYSPQSSLNGVYNSSASLVRLFGAAATPDGGSFLALDSDYNTTGGTVGKPVSTLVTGLTTGATEAVTFYWADSQQQGFSGASTDFLTVTLGSSPGQSTPTVPDNSQSFTPWISQTFDFTATGASEVLSFLATGTPTNGIAPAFALLDDVTVTQLGTPPPGMTPEPSSLMLLATGLVVMSGFIRWRMAKGQAV